MSQSNGAAHAAIRSQPDQAAASAGMPVDAAKSAALRRRRWQRRDERVAGRSGSGAARAADETPPAAAPAALTVPPLAVVSAVAERPQSRGASRARVAAGEHRAGREAKTASTEVAACGNVPAASPPRATDHRRAAAERVAERELIARGDARLDQGDIASARLFYERAADEGDARAARRLGNSFDPAFLARWGARFMRADPDQAARWYRRAGTLGDAEAAQDLAALQKH